MSEIRLKERGKAENALSVIAAHGKSGFQQIGAKFLKGADGNQLHGLYLPFSQGAANNAAVSVAKGRPVPRNGKGRFNYFFRPISSIPTTSV